MTPEITVVHVFTDADGHHGNALAIVADGSRHSDESALAIARSTGASETVFVDDPATGRVRIYVPRARVPFAGHPLVGVAWWLADEGYTPNCLHIDAGEVPVETAPGSASITTTAGRGVPWRLIEVASPHDVEAAPLGGSDRHDYVWAWSDREGGQVRARAFASSSGTPEDEATGSAAIQLAHELGRSITIQQGRGSIIDVAAHGEQYVLTGRVVREL